MLVANRAMTLDQDAVCRSQQPDAWRPGSKSWPNESDIQLRTVGMSRLVCAFNDLTVDGEALLQPRHSLQRPDELALQDLHSMSMPAAQSCERQFGHLGGSAKPAAGNSRAACACPTSHFVVLCLFEQRPPTLAWPTQGSQGIRAACHCTHRLEVAAARAWLSAILRLHDPVQSAGRFHLTLASRLSL